jgi:hypothetical protein
VIDWLLLEMRKTDGTKINDGRKRMTVIPKNLPVFT